MREALLFRWPRYCPLYRKATRFINSHATVTVCMLAVLPKGFRTELNIASPNLFALALLCRNAYFLPVGANLPPRLIRNLLILIQPLDFTFYKILSALNIMMTVDSLFLPTVALLSIYLLLKPLSSKLPTPTSADKKNSCTAKRLCTNDALSLVFFQPNTARLFFINNPTFRALSILTVLVGKCQTKSFKDEHFNQKRCSEETHKGE